MTVAPVYLESYHSLPRPGKEPGPYANYFYELPFPRRTDEENEVEETEEAKEVKPKEERKLTDGALMDVASLKNLLTISRDLMQFLLAAFGLWQSEETVRRKEAGLGSESGDQQDTLEKALRLIGILVLGSLGILLQPE